MSSVPNGPKSQPHIVTRILTTFAALAEKENWDSAIVREAELISADPAEGKIVFEMTIKPFLCSVRGRLHGGAATTILDNLTTTVVHVADPPGPPTYGSVSRTLTVQFLHPVSVGERVVVESELVSRGKNMVNVRGVIRTKGKEGRVCVICTHDKAIVGVAKPPDVENEKGVRTGKGKGMARL